jgi:glycosyltransferase involved in cell wall biosynthesis
VNLVRYSICITNRNNAPTLDASLKSILAQNVQDSEVVVVDSRSTDGSLEILKRYSDEGKIRLIVKGCSRGKGREIAFENCRGDYVISNMDTDEVYAPRLNELLSFYHSNCEGSALLCVYDATKKNRGFQNITIAPAELARKLGGWHDLQYGEDWEFWARAAKAGAYAWYAFPLIETFNEHEERLTTSNKIRFRYIRYREAIRCGRRIFSESENRTIKQNLGLIFSSFMALFYVNFRDPFNRDFDCYAESYRLPLVRSTSGAGLAG